MLGIGTGVTVDSAINTDPRDLASRDAIDRNAPNPNICQTYGSSAMVVDQRVFVTFNPFSLHVSQVRVVVMCSSEALGRLVEAYPYVCICFVAVNKETSPGESREFPSYEWPATPGKRFKPFESIQQCYSDTMQKPISHVVLVLQPTLPT